MNLSRSTKAAVVPAILAALALSACQDEAPEAKAPADPSQEQSAAPTAAPETSAAPAPSTGSSSSGGCNDTSSFKIERGSAQPKSFSTEQTGSGSAGDGKVAISFGKSDSDTSGGNTFFPGDGMKTVIYPVTLTLNSGTFYVGSYLKFSLYDDGDRSCKADVLNTVVPAADYLRTVSLKPGDSVTKKIAFAVPADADLKKYTLVFGDTTGSDAELAWNAG